MIRPGVLFLHRISHFIPTTISMCCFYEDNVVIVYDFIYKQFYYYDATYVKTNFILL
jgi:hypothetical protein